MGDKNDNRRGNNSRRRRNKINYPICPVCEKLVRDLYSAVTHKETKNPAHFDCILKILREKNELSANEKICYLGKGSFGIIQFRSNNNRFRFFIRKRIQYEETDPAPEWKKKCINVRSFR